MTVRLLFGSLAILLAASAASAAASPTSQQVRVGQDTFERFELPARTGPPVRYYISRPRARAPLVLYIQGSGCAPAFLETQPGNLASTVFSLTTVAHRGEFAVMIVEKPHAATGFPRGSGLATGCSDLFNAYFSYDSWLDRIQAAYRHALALPWVDPARSLVIGISEGATMAAGLAAREPRVTDVALVGGSGPSQFFDFVAQAYRSGSDEQIQSALTELDQQLGEIFSDPQSSTKFMWGHPYRRWSSFFRASSAESLRRSTARVYLVSGMADQSVPILSSEVNYAELRAAGRDVVFRRIADADHGLLPASADMADNFPRLEGEFSRIIDWFRGAAPAARRLPPSRP